MDSREGKDDGEVKSKKSGGVALLFLLSSFSVVGIVALWFNKFDFHACYTQTFMYC